MEKSEVIYIIKSLASGIDPQTGMEIPLDSPYRHIKTMRALHIAARQLEGPGKSYNHEELKLIPPKPTRVKTDTHEKAQPQMAGSPWTKQEDQELREDFQQGLSIASMAKKHQRSRGAIGPRLLRLGIGIIGVIDGEKAIPHAPDIPDGIETFPF